VYLASRLLQPFKTLRADEITKLKITFQDADSLIFRCVESSFKDNGFSSQTLFYIFDFIAAIEPQLQRNCHVNLWQNKRSQWKREINFISVSVV
jgi:hypothetical protein